MVKDIIGVGSITLTDLNDASISVNPPKNPDIGAIWIDSSGENNILKQFNGTEWVNASLDVSELDKDLSEKITTIENTLGNIGDDGKLTYDDRKILTEELNLIIGEVLSTSVTLKYHDALPDYVTVDSNASGSFSNYRIAARDVGIRRDNIKYNKLQEAYTNMINFLAGQGDPKPWDLRKTNQDKLTTLTNPDEFREVILNYYLAELELVSETSDRAQDMATSDTITEDKGITPMVVMPTQEGGSLQVEIPGFYSQEPEPHPDGYSIEIRTQKAVETGDGFQGEGNTEHILVPLPKVILEGERLILDSDGKWKIETPGNKIELSKKAQIGLNNIPSFRKATLLTIVDTHNTSLEITVDVKARSASWYREQKAKDYTDEAINNTGSALDVEVSGPYEIPPLPVVRLTEYTLEVMVYWRGGVNSGIIGRDTPPFSWEVQPKTYIPEEGTPQERGYVIYTPDMGYTTSSEDMLKDLYLPENRWVSLAVTYDGTRTKLFINGKLASNKPGGSQIELEKLMIGLSSTGQFDGYISNVRFWDYAKTDTDVEKYHKRRLSGEEPGLILYYRLNGGNKITDSGPHENHIEPQGPIGWVDDTTALKELDDEIQVVSTTVTQLADSWILSIKDNDDIVTAINASTEGIAIKANKFVIDVSTPVEGTPGIGNFGSLVEEVGNKATKQELQEIELTPGPEGETAYDIAVENGFQGTKQEWLDSLVGSKGKDGTTTYTWVKYADDENGKNMSDSPEDKKYIGMAFNKTTPTESNTARDYQWSLMPQNIEIGGRNLLTNTKFREIEPRNGGTASDNYNYLQINLVEDKIPLIEGAKYFFSAKVEITKGTFDSITVLSKVEGKGSNKSVGTLKIRDGKIESEYIANGKEVFFLMYAGISGRTRDQGVIFTEIQLERGDVPSDYQEAPEDTDEKINMKADTEALGNIELELGSKADKSEIEDALGEISEALGTYKKDIEALDEDKSKAIKDIADMVSSNAGTIAKYGDKIAKWTFLDTEIIMGEGGLLVGTYQYDELKDINVLINGIRVGTDSVDFVENKEIVATITNNAMEIRRGVFVDSITVGEHTISTNEDGHTTWNWTGKRN